LLGEQALELRHVLGIEALRDIHAWYQRYFWGSTQVRRLERHSLVWVSLQRLATEAIDSDGAGRERPVGIQLVGVDDSAERASVAAGTQPNNGIGFDT
jgi:hypothetical protein